MRKVLLTSVALLGLVGAASAQTPPNAPPATSTPAPTAAPPMATPPATTPPAASTPAPAAAPQRATPPPMAPAPAAAPPTAAPPATTAPAATPSPTTAAKPVKPRRPVRRIIRRAPAPAATTSDSDVRPGHEPGVGDSFPASGNASNITSGDTRSVIAPRLPSPAGGPNASVGGFLSDAQRALDRGQTGMAQEALERAETAMLQRSVPADQAGTPDQAPDVMQVKAARDALAQRDVAGAKRDVAAAMAAGR